MKIGTRFSLKKEHFDSYRTCHSPRGYDDLNAENVFYVIDYYPELQYFNYIDKIGYENGARNGHSSIGWMSIVEEFWEPKY